MSLETMTHSPPDIDRRLARIGKVADLLDARFRLPGTGIRFGADSLVGLIPGIGDTATAAVSAWIVYEAWQLGLPPHKLGRMAANVAVDAVIGTVPLVGDLFDLGWKANLRNARIIQDHFAEQDEWSEA